VVGAARGLTHRPRAWSNDGRLFAERTRAFLGGAGERDAEGMLVEDFALHDNLMIEGAVLASGGALMLGDVPEPERWRDLEAFARCVEQLAGTLERGYARP
jgi:hypothetical protein